MSSDDYHFPCFQLASKTEEKGMIKTNISHTFWLEGKNVAGAELSTVNDRLTEK